MSGLPAVVVLLLTSATVPHAASVATQPGDLAACLSRAGAEDEKAFLAFDAELREALAERDAATLAVLATYPLRINASRGGTVMIDGPVALQARFDELFPSAIRAAVLDGKPGDVRCTTAGVMYGSGALWVAPVGQGLAQRFALSVINLPDTGSSGASPTTRVEFACHTERLRAVVDGNGQDDIRYRAWNRPRALKATPDLEIRTGTRTYEGTGACSRPVWSFTAGDATIVVYGAGGCSDNPAPAVGSIRVERSGKMVREERCF